MGIYKNFVLIGGGGGQKELKNVIEVYDWQKNNATETNMLKDCVHSESTGDSVVSCIDKASEVNVFAISMGKWTCVYKIIPESGKLEQLSKI